MRSSIIQRGLAATLVACLAAPAAVAHAEEPLSARLRSAQAFAASRDAANQAALPYGRFPQTTLASGAWQTVPASAWTSGFFPGSLWLEYQRTADPAWRTRAAARQAPIAARRTDSGTHDLGFMFGPTFVQGYRLTGDPAYRSVALVAAGSLARRYDPVVGMVRSRNTAEDFHVIVDTMMNVELLYWGARNGGPCRWRDIATRHALRCASDFVRADGSTYHLVVYDEVTGAVKSSRHAPGCRTRDHVVARPGVGRLRLHRRMAGERRPAAARGGPSHRGPLRRQPPRRRDPLWDFSAVSRRRATGHLRGGGSRVGAPRARLARPGRRTPGSLRRGRTAHAGLAGRPVVPLTRHHDPLGAAARNPGRDPGVVGHRHLVGRPLLPGGDAPPAPAQARVARPAGRPGPRECQLSRAAHPRPSSTGRRRRAGPLWVAASGCNSTSGGGAPSARSRSPSTAGRHARRPSTSCSQRTAGPGDERCAP